MLLQAGYVARIRQLFIRSLIALIEKLQLEDSWVGALVELV